MQLILKWPFNRSDWKEFFRKTPVWILVLVVVMLAVRFVVTGLFYWLSGG